ncbi:MoaD/ThiS family protein [Halomarina litorea]|uniref:MoaD/ThiS family protein n=1 Tax=Halomarina litorea TaxID=2961595 RepID=UPI0020C34483|nr:MoaD/ThiS family protein [Halomarina sp. BCD28]
MRTDTPAPPTAADEEESEQQTTVEVRATGHVRRELGTGRSTYTFEGTTLREFLAAFFDDHEGLEDLLIAETEAEATAHGWARVADPPGVWRKNPEGEQTRAYARIMINGRFNEHLGGFDAELTDGDRVALVYPFMFCC